MQNQTTTIILNNGAEMPLLGLGSFLQKDVEKVVYQSIKDGVRLIDTASKYECEKEVGKALKRVIEENIVKREDLFIVTKLWIEDKPNPEEAIKRQLSDLQLDYVDLYLDHWPLTIFGTSSDNTTNAPIHVLWPKNGNLSKARTN